jgi:hypothetical protein
MLERLVQIIDERSLEDWESGPLVAQPMALLCRVYDKLEVREDEREELASSAARLGSKGGKKRAENMTAERRREVAQAAAAKRWAKD